MRRLSPIAFALALAACGGPPTQQLTEAESALADAALARKCAPDEYAAAQRLYDKARKLSEDGEYDEARLAAEAAKKQAERANHKAQMRKAECLKPPPDPTDVSDFVDPTGAVDQNKDPGGLETVFFEYNASDLTPEARKTMAANAQWLLANPDVRVTIEGHCDKRGSTEYNLALGEKRAIVVRKYLVSLGVPRDRMATISYGEEQPIDYADNESAFAKNRRAEFSVR